MQVNILEAKNRLSQLVKFAQAGEEVVIANRGVPVARLIAATPQQGAIGAARTGRAIASWLDANPLRAHRLSSHEEIEAGIAAERGSWD